jgi:hypothetical protein
MDGVLDYQDVDSPEVGVLVFTAVTLKIDLNLRLRAGETFPEATYDALSGELTLVFHDDYTETLSLKIVPAPTRAARWGHPLVTKL